MDFLKVLLLLCLAGVVSCQEGKHWALLVAGSNGYDNYRHQADICHAYRVMKNHGIPDENIVVMMYDDIAHNKENPVKGNIINQPHGPNLYPGVLKDYTGKEVNPEVFIKVLTGDEEGLKQLIGRSGKVIKSGPNDNVFVNFADHGAPGLIAFPNKFLHAKDLQAAITKMHNGKKYKKMVFYIEACESGSMFSKTLPKDINVFATTAANPTESSYACYLDKERNTYLGDVYSVMWMQNSDKENLNTLTLQKQFEIVKRETNTSHVMEYGNLTMGSMTVAQFQGNQTSLEINTSPFVSPMADAIKSEDVPMTLLQLKLSKTTTPADHMKVYKKLMALKKKYMSTDNLFYDIIRTTENNDANSVQAILESHQELTQFDCYQSAVENLHASCPGLELPSNDYALRQMYTLVNLCELGRPNLNSVIATVTRNQTSCLIPQW